MALHNEFLTIQEVAGATGLSVYTLRYYERIGLIHPINRADNTHRRYTHDDIGWIEFLNKLRAIGMSIQQMQRYTELQRVGDATLPERVEMLRDLKDEAESRLRELQVHLEIISHKIDYYQSVVDEQMAEPATP